MESILLLLGRLAALAGILICALAIYGRLTGMFYFLGFQVGTLLQVAAVTLLIGCVCFLIVLVDRSRR